MSALPKATHILDWYHLTRRLTVLKRVLLGKEAIKLFQTGYHDRLCKHLESVKWRLWHGYIGDAINRIKAILCTLRLRTIAGKQVAVRMPSCKSALSWAMAVLVPHFPDGIRALPARTIFIGLPRDPTISMIYMIFLEYSRGYVDVCRRWGRVWFWLGRAGRSGGLISRSGF